MREIFPRVLEAPKNEPRSLAGDARRKRATARRMASAREIFSRRQNNVSFLICSSGKSMIVRTMISSHVIISGQGHHNVLERPGLRTAVSQIEQKAANAFFMQILLHWCASSVSWATFLHERSVRHARDQRAELWEQRDRRKSREGSGKRGGRRVSFKSVVKSSVAAAPRRPIRGLRTGQKKLKKRLHKYRSAHYKCVP